MEGKKWLEDLPNIIKEISIRWNLSDLKPISNLSYNYILSGLEDLKPVILKLGLDKKALKTESEALKAFENYGAIKVLNQIDGALLLEQAFPATLLKDYFPAKDEEATLIAGKIIKLLHSAPYSQNNIFPNIKDWLIKLDKNYNIPSDYILKARKLRDELLITSPTSLLLHGDLHHDNILQSGNEWCIIDPKGVVGDAAYEVGAFIRNPIVGLIVLDEDIVNIINKRVMLLANILNLEANRIRKWCFVQSVLTWIWAIEDNMDTHYFSHLTKVFDNINI